MVFSIPNILSVTFTMMMFLCLSIFLVAQPIHAFWGNGGGGFSFNFGGPVRKPTCYWNANPVPEATALGQETICYDTKPFYNQAQIDMALNGDRAATFFYNNIIEMYQPMNQTYFHNYGNYRYQDMCPVIPQRVLRVNALDKYGNVEAQCNIVNPYKQNIFMATCGTNCQFDQETSLNHFCVPDGYIERYALAFCPSSRVQCRPVKLKIPIGCSCKKYTCLSYAK